VQRATDEVSCIATTNNDRNHNAPIRSTCFNPNYELHQEDLTGSLEMGKLADLIVLDRNIFEVPAEQIATIKVIETIVGGRVVFRATDFLLQ
jgi:predicted amidohydrolase YtcJ